MGTHLEEFLSNNLDADISALKPCDQKEADLRLLLHALDASESGFKRLLTVTVDTYVLHWLCVTSSTWILRSCGSRLVPEKIADGFPFIYMRKHCTRRCVKHCHFGSLWLDIILFDVCWPGKKDSMVCMVKVSGSNTSFQKVKYLSPIHNSSKIIRSNISKKRVKCLK